MKIERETKLLVGAGFSMPDLSVSEALESEADGSERFVSSYHDTPDLRLLRWGATLRYRPTDGWTVKLPGGSDGAMLEREEHVIEGGPGRPPAAAADLVRAFVRGTTLRPVARLQTVRRRWRVSRPGEKGLLAEVVDDEVAVLEGRREVGGFREVEVELADGVDPSVAKPIVDLLADAGARIAEPVPKIVRALGERADVAPEVDVPALDRASTVAEAVRRAVASSTVRLIASDPAVRLGLDPEGVHGARVATRRLRSDLRTFRRLLDARWRRGLREELGWLGAELGRVRDVDVLEERLREHVPSLPDADAAGAAEVLDRLEAQRSSARDELLAAMREPRYLALLDALVEGSAAPAVLERVAERRAADVLGEAMERPWSHLERLCGRLADDASDEELHEARIRAKRVRYAAEALAPVFGKPARRFARRAETLQTVLGTHQDAVMAIAWLREQAGASSPAASFSAGRLAGLEAAVRDEARRTWPDAWADLRRARLRFWE